MGVQSSDSEVCQSFDTSNEEGKQHVSLQKSSSGGRDDCSKTPFLPMREIQSTSKYRAAGMSLAWQSSAARRSQALPLCLLPSCVVNVPQGGASCRPLYDPAVKF